MKKVSIVVLLFTTFIGLLGFSCSVFAATTGDIIGIENYEKNTYRIDHTDIRPNGSISGYTLGGLQNKYILKNGENQIIRVYSIDRDGRIYYSRINEYVTKSGNLLIKYIEITDSSIAFYSNENDTSNNYLSYTLESDMPEYDVYIEFKEHLDLVDDGITKGDDKTWIQKNWLYVGIGALALIAVVVLVSKRKRK